MSPAPSGAGQAPCAAEAAFSSGLRTCGPLGDDAAVSDGIYPTLTEVGLRDLIPESERPVSRASSPWAASPSACTWTRSVSPRPDGGPPRLAFKQECVWASRGLESPPPSLQGSRGPAGSAPRNLRAGQWWTPRGPSPGVSLGEGGGHGGQACGYNTPGPTTVHVCGPVLPLKLPWGRPVTPPLGHRDQGRGAGPGDQLHPGPRPLGGGSAQPLAP